jgi:hypothetical protein
VLAKYFALFSWFQMLYVSCYYQMKRKLLSLHSISPDQLVNIEQFKSLMLEYKERYTVFVWCLLYTFEVVSPIVLPLYIYILVFTVDTINLPNNSQ